MRAIILAAGRGVRLQLPEDSQLPKCLLRFDGMTLLPPPPGRWDELAAAEYGVVRRGHLPQRRLYRRRSVR